MIFIDCSEGLSADMLLAAMLGLVPRDERAGLTKRLGEAASGLGLGLTVGQIEEEGGSGLSIVYSSKREDCPEVSYEDAHWVIDKLAGQLGSPPVLPRKILGHIFDAEAEAHGLPKERVHLHEIGRPQAMLNIAGIGLVHHELTAGRAEKFVASTITTGKGMVVVSHGAVRVPAPAARILLRGLKHKVGDDPGERATPTGIAAVKAMIDSQSDEMPAKFSAKSIGFGSKRFGGRLGRTTLFKV